MSSSDAIDMVTDAKNLSDLISVLKTRAPRIAVTVAVANALWPSVKFARSKISERRWYSVKVSGADEAYDEIHTWVLSLLEPREQRALIAYSCYDTAHGKLPIGLRYDGTRTQVVRVRGHKVNVSVVESSGREAESRDGGAWKPPEVVLTTQSAAGRDVIVGELARIVTEMRTTSKRPSVKILSEWGWDRLSNVPERPLESVVLPAGQQERILRDMSQFLSAEGEYVRRGIPWHRGYLFEGPPGTGKTSIAQALAAHFKMDLWYFPLGDLRKDADLLQRISQVSSRSVLLLEDIDVFSVAQNRDKNDSDGTSSDTRASLAGLLNAVDGVATPHGLITIMTANRPLKLDEAIRRPGRVDVTEHFGLCSSEQAMRLLGYYYGMKLRDHGDLGGVAPAVILEACKSSATPDAAVVKIRRARAKQVPVGPEDVTVANGVL